jgi:hypothetical protein
MSPRLPQHANTELLSAYLDDEVGLVEARALESHLESCGACRARLRALRGVVHQLSALERPAPPPWLITQVRREVLYTPKESLWARLGRSLMQVPFAAPAASMLVSVTFMVLLFSSFGGGIVKQGLPGLANYPGPVEELKADPNQEVIEATSEVAGRKFVRHEDDDVWNAWLYATAGPAASADQPVKNVWVEQGLPDHAPIARVDARSPQGRALLARDPDLGYLLADGSRVVMRYQRETLELRSGA